MHSLPCEVWYFDNVMEGYLRWMCLFKANQLMSSVITRRLEKLEMGSNYILYISYGVLRN